MSDFYSLSNILKKHAHYNVIYGERSNGKTYSVLLYGLEEFYTKGSQLAIIRRWKTDLDSMQANEMFKGLINNGEVSRVTNGEYDTIVYRNKVWTLAKIVDGDVELDDKPFAFGFALSLEEHYKSTSFNNIRNILFDEFISRDYYLPDEFLRFTSILSTIIRLRDDVKIFMCGNSINKYNPYFAEMGLNRAKNQKKGTIDLYNYGNSGLKVAVEFSDFKSTNKKSNVYFAFENPKLNMVKSGDWEIKSYPHLPYKYTRDNVVYTFYIKFDDEIFSCDVVNCEDDLFIYVMRKTTDLKYLKDDLIYQLEVSEKENIRNNIFKAFTKFENRILSIIQKNKIFYQNNEIGNTIENFFNKCREVA